MVYHGIAGGCVHAGAHAKSMTEQPGAAAQVVIVEDALAEKRAD